MASRLHQPATTLPTYFIFLFLLILSSVSMAAAFKLEPMVMMIMGHSPLKRREVENLQV